MRLIDADRLRNIAISNRDVEMVYEIDHSPTVEAYIFEQVQDLVALNKKLSEERPHGEWKNGVCTNCGAECFEDYYMRDIKTEFCHRCGADMRTQNDRKAEEEWYRKQREESEERDRWAGGLYHRD